MRMAPAAPVGAPWPAWGAFHWGGFFRPVRKRSLKMKTRALPIAVPVVVVCLVAGSIFAFFFFFFFFAGGGSLGGGVFTVTVAIEDSHGTTLASDSTDTITLALGRNPGHGALTCTSTGGLTATVTAGRATFGGCSISRPGIGYRLTATSSVKPALGRAANGHTFVVLSAAAAKAAAREAAGAAGLSFTDASVGNGQGGAPAEVTCSGTVGDSFSCTVSPVPPRGKARFMTARVLLIDQFRNPVTNSSGSDLDVTLTQTGGSSLSTGSVPIPAGAASSDPFTEDLGGGHAHGTVSAAAAVGPGQATASLTS